ncbi:MAG: 2,3-epoxybenzoyl-CoA dihydrolase [Myxococcota bacterium]|nr:2,3-epoxybenzoyl-CoA dihydrolase [Myxococcota bacterium]
MTLKIERFETHPDVYKHWQLEVDGPVARLTMNVQEDDGSGKPYILKLNSYDIFVDLELADAVTRLRFEHPNVKAVVITSAQDRIFCAGANIPMLAASSHGFKVNFCKFTNETRLSIEDASQESDQKYIAACNGVASGGGYELALACDEIILVDDRSSAVSLPEVPLLGVLPGTGGLTRVVDKRKVRRDLADHFSSLAEGVRGKRAVEWRLIDATYKLSKFDEGVQKHVDQVLSTVPDKVNAAGITWHPLDVEVLDDGSRHYEYVTLDVNADERTATLTMKAPSEEGPTSVASIREAGTDWWPLKAFRQLDDALLHLRLNLLDIGTVMVRTTGNKSNVLAVDDILNRHRDDWFVSEVLHFVKRTLKRMDYTAKTFFALGDEGSAFAGCLFELALASDRFFMLDDPDETVAIALSAANAGMYPMGNGLSRLETRFLGDPGHVGRVLEHQGQSLTTAEAYDLGLVTFNPDDIDWDDEVRVAVEERRAMSPDALTGMEANLRFAGPETLETKIFGRLSAWQNWIFQRPNAVGAEGALKAFGQPTAAKFNWERT